MYKTADDVPEEMIETLAHSLRRFAIRFCRESGRNLDAQNYDLKYWREEAKRMILVFYDDIPVPL